jgi:hypothetical protein
VIAKTPLIRKKSPPSAQKSHVKPPESPNFRIAISKKHKQNDLQRKNISAQSGILVMPHSIK